MSDQKPKQQKPQQPQQPILEREIKQNAGVSATMALQAAQKAYEYKQAANAAGDPNAREEILAKAINKEIEAESFGKAAKYTQSGAFQGLAAGAGLGVQPGVTLGKVTGAIVGGTVATVTGLLGGGIGSVYGAMHGPMWNLGEMASHGVRGVVGDFPNWTSTPSQKKALEKMVMQSKETQAPSKEELERMKSEMPDQMPESWGERVGDLTSWRPSLPEMPSLKKVGGAVGLGGLGASLGLGGMKTPEGGSGQPKRAAETAKAQPSKSQRISARQQEAKTSNKESESKLPASKSATAPSKEAKGPKKSAPSTHAKSSDPSATTKPSNGTSMERRKPRKLNQKPSGANMSSVPAQRRAPRKLGRRNTSAAA